MLSVVIALWGMPFSVKEHLFSLNIVEKRPALFRDGGLLYSRMDETEDNVKR